MIGRYIAIDSSDGKYWALIQVRERLTKHLYLVQAVEHDTGEASALGSYILDIRELTSGENYQRGRIFDDFAGVQRYREVIDGPPDDGAGEPAHLVETEETRH